MRKLFRIAATALALTASASLAQAEWKPSGPIKMMIAFTAGGGADTSARLLAEGISQETGWTIIPENVTGKGGAVMARALREEPADGLSIGITVDQTLGYTVISTKNPGYGLDDFTYLSAITGTQMALIAKKDRGWNTIEDVFADMKTGTKIRAGAMSTKLADGLYMLGKANGVEFTTVMLRGGKAGLNGVIADDLDIAYAAGVQTKAVKSGDVVNLVSMEKGKLKVSPDAPLVADLGIPYSFGAKFIVIGPAGMPEEAQAAFKSAIEKVATNPESKVHKFISRAFTGPEMIQGEALEKHVRELQAQDQALLDDASN